MQVDFLAAALPGEHAGSSTGAFPDAVVTAGMYRQIRLRFASLEAARAANRCAGAALHCAVLSDGQVWPLAFPASTSHVQMLLEEFASQAVYVPPGGTVALGIEIDPNRSWVWRSGESMVLQPVFRPSIRQLPVPD